MAREAAFFFEVTFLTQENASFHISISLSLTHSVFYFTTFAVASLVYHLCLMCVCASAKKKIKSSAETFWESRNR